jgi:plasmid stability protein
MNTRNLTVNLPEPLLRRLRVCAALRNESMTAVIREAIERTVEESGEGQKAARRLVRRLRSSPDRRIGGRITWTRDELHER